MARNTLAERMNRVEQQRARLAEEEARIKDQERKQRTRRLIETGGLVEKAGLLDLEPNALLGGLIALKEMSAKPDLVARFAAEGGRLFAAEAKAKDTGREPLIVTFPSPIARDLTAQLRAAGLRWNKVLQHWEGIAEHAAVSAIVSPGGGSVRRVRTDANAPGGAPASAVAAG